jgi:nitroimidazol reductase NimA-like FMN-containing flavoprotein (pyridoxamine 5'-phosphate oxidase superfamily)
MTFDGSGLRILTDAECYRRLESVRIGRVALSWRAMPLILPVHFRLLDHTLLLSTTPGTTLDRATDGAVVAFEAEGPAGRDEPLWSVVASGMATHRPADPFDRRARVQVEIDVSSISGREELDPLSPMAPLHLTSVPRW